MLKKHGMSHVAIRKMASGSVVGTFIAVPVSLLLSSALLPVGRNDQGVLCLPQDEKSVQEQLSALPSVTSVLICHPGSGVEILNKKE